MAVGTNYYRRPSNTISAPRLALSVQPEYAYVEASRTPESHQSRLRTSAGSPSRSSSPSPVRNIPHIGNEQPYEPVIDWQCLEYTSRVDENLLCAICKAPFHKPLTTKACGHTFCEACIDQALEEARGRTRNRVPCPLCRTDLSTGGDRGSHRFVRVVEMSAHLDQLEVRCPNNTQLCKWTGPRSSLENHVRNVCEYTLLPCASSSCDKMIIRKSRGDGSLEGAPFCRHFSSACDLCHETIDMSTKVQHLLTTCREYMAPCPYCGESIVREQLAAHGDICADEETACTYAKLGCSFTSVRRDIVAHRKTCEHGPFMRVFEEVLEKRLKEKMDRVKMTVTREMEQILQRDRQRVETVVHDIREELQEERRKREELAQSLSSIDSPELGALRYRGLASGNAPADEGSSQPGRSSLPIPARSDYEQAEYMFRMFDELDTRISNVSKALIDQDARHSVMLLNELMPVKEQLVEARSQLGVMGMHVRWLMDLQRARQRQIAEVVSGLTGAGGSGSSSSASTTSSSDAIRSDSRQANPGNSGGAGGSGDNLPGISRRLGDRTSPVRPSL